MRKFAGIAFLLFVVNLVGLFSPNYSYPISGTVAATPLTPIFPISQLGNCGSVAECAVFCDNPVNFGICTLVGKHLALLPTAAVAESDSAVAGEEFDPQEEAKKRGITFPIAELGNCTTVAECMNYCDNPANSDQCVAFAKKKGFYREPSEVEEKFLQAARTELGCTSTKSCMTFCDNPAHYEKCAGFAERFGGAHSQAEYRDYQGRGVSVTFPIPELGNCGSPDECRAYCENPANLQQCADFARQRGMYPSQSPGLYPTPTGGYVGPGGCKTAEECERYCREHPSECSGSKPYPTSYTPYPTSYTPISQPTYTDTPYPTSSPSGFPCQTEAECRRYCDANPAACGGYTGTGSYSQPQPPQYPPPTTYEQPYYTPYPSP